MLLILHRLGHDTLPWEGWDLTLPLPRVGLPFTHKLSSNRRP